MSSDHPFDRFLQRIRPSYVLAGLILFGFVLGEVASTIQLCQFASSGVCGNAPSAADLLAEQNSLIVYNGTYWELFTSIFVTSSYLDAAFNAIAVLVLEYFLPIPFNKTRYFAIFFFSAILGNLFTLLEGPAYGSAGASGGIFGLFAAAFAYSWAEEKRIDLPTLVLFGLIFVTSSFLVANNVNWIAHLGGSIGGFIAAPLLYYKVKDKLADFSMITMSSLAFKILVWGGIVLLTAASIVQFLVFVLIP
ncbi:MAG: rhomboid family intramembrane serine protease [Nitrososphaerales archaeon]